jgi:hypothetical protein
LAVDGVIDGDADASAAGADAATEGGALAGAAFPHAPTVNATTEARVANRVNLLLPMTLLLPWCPRHR